MKAYNRNEPHFSLCGLNCALCPRYHTEGTSKCPGCGGEDFYLKHPTCAIITCNNKHEHVEFCFECSEYPCERYNFPKNVDSFISYKNIEQNMADAKSDLASYLKELSEKKCILEQLITHHNDGKSKGFFCLAVNLLSLDTLNEIITALQNNIDTDAVGLLKQKANELGIELKLRKELKNELGEK